MFQSYMMRNCVLGVLGEILSATLAREQLSEELKETRNIFFDHLEDHLLDSNGSVRGKVTKVQSSSCSVKLPFKC